MIEKGGPMIRAETTTEKHISGMLKSIDSVKHLGLKGDELLIHAVRFSALRKLIVRNERKIKTKEKYPQFEYDIKNIRNAKDINATIQRLASETEINEEDLKKEYGNYFKDYSAEKIKKIVFKEIQKL